MLRRGLIPSRLNVTSQSWLDNVALPSQEDSVARAVHPHGWWEWVVPAQVVLVFISPFRCQCCTWPVINLLC